MAALLRKLKHLRAKPSRAVFESNTLFDTPSRDFSRCGSILRIRTETPASAPGKIRSIPKHRGKSVTGLLTYKGLLPKSASSNPRYKIREEIEYRLPNAQRFERLLLSLGLKPLFRYEKFRTRYRLPSHPDLHLDLDETPIGVFLELEGSRHAIDHAARLLGFRSGDYINVSYLELYLADCRRRGRKPGHMVFTSKKSSR
ncbi:MAG TPA: class IV adenylate cyclase [Candidatus Acidoferrales bacterium]|nr:class IV adenylate cyclase [Candidatus Acidoferrales bacterium]